jgi:hypothetical protein
MLQTLLDSLASFIITVISVAGIFLILLPSRWFSASCCTRWFERSLRQSSASPA